MKDNINIYIYMTDANICIKEEIESFIEKYKKGDIFQVDIAIKIAEIVDNIDCFFCLDQKQCWDYRGKKYISDNNYDLKKVKILVGIIFLNMASLHHAPFDKLLFHLSRIWLFKEIKSI